LLGLLERMQSHQNHPSSHHRSSSKSHISAEEELLRKLKRSRAILVDFDRRCSRLCSLAHIKQPPSELGDIARRRIRRSLGAEPVRYSDARPRLDRTLFRHDRNDLCSPHHPYFDSTSDSSSDSSI
jgi:hypothetical protein